MAVTLYDETVRRPTWRYWLTIAGLIGVSGLTVAGATSYLFPRETVTLASLDATPSKTEGPLTVSADSPPSTSTQSASTPTTLESFQDSIRGFQVSHPKDWTVWSADGAVLVRSDTCGTTTLLFYPLELIDKAITAKMLITDTTGVIANQLGSAGTLTVGRVDTSREGTATTLLSGTVCGNAVEGSVQATVQGSQALVKLNWFPSSQKDQLTNTINSMLQSYKTIQAQILAYLGTKIALAVPAGWTVAESTDSATANSGENSVSASTVNFSASASLDTAFDEWLEMQHAVGNTLSDWSLDADTAFSLDVDGHHWNGKTQFVHYAKDGKTYRGALTASYTDLLGNAAWVLWRTAPDATWVNETSELTAVEQSATLMGASTRLPSGIAQSALPTLQTAPDDQSLVGPAFRDALRSTAAGRFNSKIDSFQPLLAPSGDRFYATLNARSLTTGTFTTSVSGQTVTLSEEQEEGTHADSSTE